MSTSNPYFSQTKCHTEDVLFEWAQMALITYDLPSAPDWRHHWSTVDSLVAEVIWQTEFSPLGDAKKVLDDAFNGDDPAFRDDDGSHCLCTLMPVNLKNAVSKDEKYIHSLREKDPKPSIEDFREKCMSDPDVCKVRSEFWKTEGHHYGMSDPALLDKIANLTIHRPKQRSGSKVLYSVRADVPVFQSELIYSLAHQDIIRGQDMVNPCAEGWPEEWLFAGKGYMSQKDAREAESKLALLIPSLYDQDPITRKARMLELSKFYPAPQDEYSTAKDPKQRREKRFQALLDVLHKHFTGDDLHLLHSPLDPPGSWESCDTCQNLTRGMTRYGSAAIATKI